jgi:beta-phosphoglucomutase
MAKALIFDFDGVIVLSEQARFAALQQLAERYDVHIRDELFKSIIGRTTNDFFRFFMPGLDKTVLQKILDDLQREYRDNIVDHVTPIIATIDFIKTYRGSRKLAVASGSGTVVLHTVLKHLGIFDKFATIVSKDHVTKHKPDPQVYILAAQQLGCPAPDCIVIEDTVVGAQAALNAGMSVCVFLNGVNNRDEFDGVPVAGFLETTKQIREAIVD